MMDKRALRMRQEAEHIITFTTPGEKPLPDNDVALKVLRQFYNRGVLNITQCYLYLENKDDKYLVIKERNHNETEIERFNLDKILDPIYKLSNDPIDRMNNLFFFKISAASGTLSERHEFHIFQLNSICSMEFVNMLLILRDDSNTPRKKKISEMTITPYQEEPVIKDIPGSPVEICYGHINSRGGQNTRPELPASRRRFTERRALNNHLENIELLSARINNPEGRTFTRVSWKMDDITIPSTVTKKRMRKVSKRQIKWDSMHSLSNLSLNSDNRVLPMDDVNQVSMETLMKYVQYIREALAILARNRHIDEKQARSLCQSLFIYLRQPMNVVGQTYTRALISGVSTPPFTEETVDFISTALNQTRHQAFWEELGPNWTRGGGRL